MNQLTLFDAAPAPPRAGAAPPQPAAEPFIAASAAKPAERRRKADEPQQLPPVVIDAPQMPPFGAFAKIDGHWHRWKKGGVGGETLGWEIVRPPEHSAHLRDTPPRLGGNGWIDEPHPAPAIIHVDGHKLRVKWSEHGFSIYAVEDEGDRFLLHFRALAGCAISAAEIARADEHFQQLLAALTEAEPNDDTDEDAIALQEFEAEWPEDAREDDPADDGPPATQPPASELPRDELGERLIAEGLTPNGYLLDLNRSLSPPRDLELPAPWNLPSRLFRFPIETNAASVGRDGAVHPRTVGLMHPLLAEHPWVIEVEKRLSIKLDPNGAPNPYGYTKTRNALWWHAVDLISAGMWRELLETRQFTTDDDIIGAVGYGLDYGHLNAADAQQILKAIGCAIPRDPSPVDALRVVSLSEFKGESGKLQRATNWMSGPGRDANVWARITGMERGWFKMKGSFLTWTDRALVEQRNLKIAAGETVAALPVPEGSLL